MWRYIVAHWKGEQSLPRSVLFNWLLVYLLLLLLAGLSETLSIGDMGPFAWVFIGAMLAWLVWAIVGVMRRGWRVLADPDASTLRKIGASVAIPLATAFVVVAARDFYHVFYYYARPVPGGGIKAAMLRAATSSWWISARRHVRWVPPHPPVEPRHHDRRL